ncbi:hypothetical protein [Maribacter thermophilus]|uniref:hypothetical protein n=1 Tax=Maribacter thermophilus TaxID=1197874 RepID=UPI0012F8038C|nr:hypothetical protein [Maribacter thermophilus]
MNRSLKVASNQFIIVLGALTTSLSALGQKESTSFTESFNVADDAVLNINTSYADIEFETWNKNTVEVVTTIELEGATKKEAEDYFGKQPVKVMGNSKSIEITSGTDRFGLFGPQEFNYSDFNIEIPEVTPFVVEIPEIAPFPEIAEMPPLPDTKAFKFDYEAYEKDGDKYMRKWQKNFEKSFDKKHQKKLEEWAKRMEESFQEEQLKAYEKRREDLLKKREDLLEESQKRRERLLEEREEKLDKLHKERDEHIEFIHMRRDSLRNAPNIFYYSTGEEHKKFKIKKTIKIKMPKSTKIKMNVRHGEVKLAENTKNLNATLSHSSLWASTIEGDETDVSVSYSPVSIQRWNYGQLKTNYSQDIALNEVDNIQLQINSSAVTIDKLLRKAFIKNDFGSLQIGALSKELEEMDVSLKNAELIFSLPTIATEIYIKGNSSEINLPKSLKLNKTTNGNTTVYKGNHLGGNTNASIVITSDYSEVFVE